MAVIDSLEFARTGQTLGGRLQIAQLPRLQDSLFDADGEVQYEVRGGHDARQRPVLKIEISGALHLRCQRCLGKLSQPLRLSNTLTLAIGNEAAGPGLDEEDGEWIEASASLDVTDLVEDEILLSLPFSPRHGEGSCGQGADGNETKRAAGAAFSKLATLKRGNH